MDNQVVMGVSNRAAYFAEQLDTVFDSQSFLITERRYRFTFNILHRDERQPLACVPAIQQARDVRMIKRSQDVALTDEAPDDFIRVHSALDDLQGDLLMKACPLGKINRAHPAATNFPNHAVVADFRSAGDFISSQDARARGKYVSVKEPLTLRSPVRS